MIRVHHLADSRSQRVLWLLEELGLDYEVVRYERDPQTYLAPPALRAVHPLGKSPVAEEGDVRVAETGAIVEWLLETYDSGQLRPPAGTEAARRFTYWLHYAEGSAMTPLLLKLVFTRLPGGAPGLVRPLVKRIAAKAQSGFVDPQIETHIAYWEAELARSDWFAPDSRLPRSHPRAAGLSGGPRPGRRLRLCLSAGERRFMTAPSIGLTAISLG